MSLRRWKCANRALLVILLLTLFIGLFPTFKFSDSPTNSPSPSLFGGTDYLQAQGYLQNRMIRLFAEYNDSAHLSQLQSTIALVHGHIIAQLDSVHILSLQIPYAALPSLQTDGHRLYLDRKIQACLDQSVPLIKPAWSQVESFFGTALNGSRITVAVLDSGITATHPDLNDLDDNATSTDPKVIAQYNFLTNSTYAPDDNGHGTHVAGIIGGTGFQSAGARKGVAPGCYLLNGKVLNQSGVGWESDLIRGIEWAVANGTDVINLSLETLEPGDGRDPLSQAVAWAWDQGVPVVIAAGNIPQPSARPYGVNIPGVTQKGITVGATDKSRLLWANSPWGPTRDFRLKPDLLAPGVNILSCDSDASGYVSMSGTSQACAHVSGAVALLLQAHPTWTPQQIKDALLCTARNLQLEPYQQGAGFVNVTAAINTSLIITAVADFQFFQFNPSFSVIHFLYITNLRPYPINFTHQTPHHFSLSAIFNLTNPFTLPGFATRTLILTPHYANISQSPSPRVWEYLNFTAERRTIHTIACGLVAHSNFTAPIQAILYNTSIPLMLTTNLDMYPIDWLTNMYYNITVNISATTSARYSVFLTGNGTYNYNFSSPLLYRGLHAIRVELRHSGALIASANSSISIRGYNSSLGILDQTVEQWTRASFGVNITENITGPLKLYLYSGGSWELFDEAPSPTTPFAFQMNLNPGTYTFRVVFEGGPTCEPSATTFTVYVVWNHYLPYYIITVIFLAIIIALTAIYYRQKGRWEHMKRQQYEAAQKRHEERAAYQDLQERTDNRPPNPLDELGEKLYTSAATALAAGTSVDEPDSYSELLRQILEARTIDDQMYVFFQKCKELAEHKRWEDGAQLSTALRQRLPRAYAEFCYYQTGKFLIAQGNPLEADRVLNEGIRLAAKFKLQMVDLLLGIARKLPDNTKFKQYAQWKKAPDTIPTQELPDQPEATPEPPEKASVAAQPKSAPPPSELPSLEVPKKQYSDLTPVLPFLTTDQPPTPAELDALHTFIRAPSSVSDRVQRFADVVDYLEGQDRRRDVKALMQEAPKLLQVPSDPPPQIILEEPILFRLGERLLLPIYNLTQLAAAILEAGVDQPRGRSTRIYDLLIHAFDASHLNQPTKVAKYQELRVRAESIDALFVGIQ